MGVDFSTNALHCAYGEVDNPHPKIVKIPVDGDFAEDWIGHIADRFGILLDQLEDMGEIELSLMVIERPFYSTNPRTTLKLAQVQAAAICTAHTHKWVTCQKDPSEIRKEVLGVGTAKGKGKIKELAQEWVTKEFGRSFDPDESDALVIWRFACLTIKQST